MSEGLSPEDIEEAVRSRVFVPADLPPVQKPSVVTIVTQFHHTDDESGETISCESRFAQDCVEEEQPYIRKFKLSSDDSPLTVDKGWLSDICWICIKNNNPMVKKNQEGSNLIVDGKYMIPPQACFVVRLLAYYPDTDPIMLTVDKGEVNIQIQATN